MRRRLRGAGRAGRWLPVAVAALPLFFGGIAPVRADLLETPPRAQAQSHPRTLDLARAYRRMLLNAPELHAARAARAAGREAKDIARAGLLPRASVNYRRSRTRLAEEVTQSGSPGERVTVKDAFSGRRTDVSIEQPLFDYSAISAYRMGRTQSEHAEVQYRLETQQVALGMIDIYLNAVLARETLALARQQLRVYEDMLRGNERMMAQGEGTRIDVLETRTQAGATRSGLLAQENELADRLRELSAIVGEPVEAAQLLGIDLEEARIPLGEADLDGLLSDALRQNPELQATRLAVKYNDLAVEREKGQFLAKVSVYAAHERVASDTINNKGRDYKANTVGLSASLPLFSGGGSYYTVRQSRERLEQARHELDHAVETARTMLEKYFRVCASSEERVRTLRQNVADSVGLVEAMRWSVAGGERTNTDALHAERQAYQARLELLRTCVEWFQAYAKMRFYAGRFSEEDVLALNRQLAVEMR
ncbi:MAG: TolC family outer membrane protein [Azoarcus sp.]|jgi:protease secretion system outer membrane protein|nr:TolC family outer membrane protein [Azoarcus sp.]